MAEPVKPKREYRSAHRAAQASQTRATLLRAAGELFVRDGWQRTTIAAIALQAGVSVETVYAGFGSKLALLEAVVVAAVRGQQPDTAIMDQDGPRRVLGADDPKRQIMLFAEDISRVLSRAAPLMAVVRAAAQSEPRLHELYVGLHRARAANFGRLVDALQGNGPLRIDRAIAVATVARLASPELFLLVTEIEGRTVDQYATWLADCLTTLLLA